MPRHGPIIVVVCRCCCCLLLEDNGKKGRITADADRCTSRHSARAYLEDCSLARWGRRTADASSTQPPHHTASDSSSAPLLVLPSLAPRAYKRRSRETSQTRWGPATAARRRSSRKFVVATVAAAVRPARRQRFVDRHDDRSMEVKALFLAIDSSRGRRAVMLGSIKKFAVVRAMVVGGCHPIPQPTRACRASNVFVCDMSATQQAGLKR